MLTCLIVAGSLWIGDDTRMFPTQGAFYFIKPVSYTHLTLPTNREV